MEGSDLEKSYINLLDRIKAETRSSNILKDLIAHYSPILFSNENKKISGFRKTFENFWSVGNQNKINSIDDLFHHLDIKNIINKNNIEPLYFIIKKVNNNNIIKIFFEKHQNLIISSENNCNASIEVKTPEGLDLKVRDAVCQGITRRWKNLGRELGLTDEQIDQIEYKHRDEDLTVCAQKVIDHFESTTAPSEYCSKLYDALSAAKRRDLADKVKSMMDPVEQ